MSRPSHLLSVLCAAALGASVSWAGPSTSGDRYEFRTPRRETFHFSPPAQGLSAGTRSAEWLSAVPEGAAEVPVEFGSRVAIQIEPGANLLQILAGSPLTLSRTITSTVFVLQAPDAMTAVREAARLANSPEVTASYPVVRRSGSVDGSYARQPNDPNFAPLRRGIVGQWYLENRDPATGAPLGADINVRGAWPVTEGQGTTIAVADEGVELGHPELVQRTLGAPHYDFSSNTTNGAPLNTNTLWHGTAVAGLAAAEGNNHYGMIGVAPLARIASWQIFQADNVLVSDEQLMDMYAHAMDTVDVQNHSWGNGGVRQTGLTLLETEGIAKAVREGRGGRGTVIVRSGGNDRTRGANADDDGHLSDPRVIAVAAVTRQGKVASFSEPGACILVATPGGETNSNGLFATDLTEGRGATQFGFFPPDDYLWNFMFNSFGFSGTSASAPLVSGVAALCLAVNPSLTYRDVQQVLLLSARHFDQADVDLRTNGAGFLVSHNVGFGVPDAGVAVNLAREWSNRPPLVTLSFTATNRLAIPDDSLRLQVSGENVPAALGSIRGLAATGPHPDDPMVALPIVGVGLATNTLTESLAGKAALIDRGTNSYIDKIMNVAQAGAALAVIRNFQTNTGTGCPGGDQLCLMGGTDFMPIPAFFISYNSGQELGDLIKTNASARARLQANPASVTFTVTNTLLCEHVGVRLQTDHSLRGDLRVTLLSPQGTRSVLQRYSGDTTAGPVDWTYYSTHHFYESSTGEWTLDVSDELQGHTGAIQLATLIINGVQIKDTDHDGLDDEWEQAHFGNLASGPKDDPDGDGYSNAREQIMGTDPRALNGPLRLDLAVWNENLARLSWPSVTNRTYAVWAGEAADHLTLVTNVAGRLFETEWFVPYTNNLTRFYQIRSSP